MTSVTITKSKKGEYKRVTCEGHAGYADAGNDIVCSAVSMLVINTFNSIERLTDTKLTVSSDEKRGWIDCRFAEGLDAGGRLLLDSMVLGLENVISEYGKKYLKLKFREV